MQTGNQAELNPETAKQLAERRGRQNENIPLRNGLFWTENNAEGIPENHRQGDPEAGEHIRLD